MYAEEERQPRLRLAAKTLIEWETPVGNPQFRRVVEQLIANNVIAHNRLTVNAKCLRLDQDRTIIWYLSENIGSIIERQEEPLDVTKKDLVSELVDAIEKIEIESEGDARKKREELTEALLKCLSTDEVSYFEPAAHAAFLLVVGDRSANVLGLLEKLVALSEPRFGDKIRQVREKYSRAINAVISVCVSAAVGAGILALEAIYDIKKVAVAGYLAIGALPVLLGVIWIVVTVIRKSRMVRWTTNKAVMRTIVGMNRDEISPNQVLAAMGRICATSPTGFRDLIQRRQGEYWASALLQFVSKPEEETLLQAIRLLKEKDLDLATKEQVFRWICELEEAGK